MSPDLLRQARRRAEQRARLVVVLRQRPAAGGAPARLRQLPGEGGRVSPGSGAPAGLPAPRAGQASPVQPGDEWPGTELPESRSGLRAQP